MNSSTGLYMCGTILLTLALLGLIITLALKHEDTSNKELWAEINSQLLEAEKEAEDD